eukprot:739137_1
MPRKKRSFKEMESDSNCEQEEVGPPRKRLRRLSEKQKPKEEESKNMFDLEVFEFESIAIIAPDPDQIKGSSKIAAFDMDWTLVKPKGKGKFPKGRKDWVWMYKDVITKRNIVPTQLKQLHRDGYQVVIFSNQNGIGSGKQSLDSVSGKVIDLSEALEIPLFGFLSIHKDHWRKPNTSMWDYFVAHYNNDVAIDCNGSFYCGDAAGRPKAWKNKKTKNDFSCADRKFGHNIGIPFHTPDAYFLGEKENTTWTWLSLNPLEYIEKKENDPERIKDPKNWFHGALPIASSTFASCTLDMVLMHGPPCCGKSTFAKKYLVSKGYEWINMDTLKSKRKCLDAAREALMSGTSVVIDNANPDYEAREDYIEIGFECKANIRLFNMTAPRELAKHMSLVRERISKGIVKRIPELVYNMYYRKVCACGISDPPDLDEGLNEIVDIDLILDFEDEQTKKLWCQFTRNIRV